MRFFKSEAAASDLPAERFRASAALAELDPQASGWDDRRAAVWASPSAEATAVPVVVVCRRAWSGLQLLALLAPISRRCASLHELTLVFAIGRRSRVQHGRALTP